MAAPMAHFKTWAAFCSALGSGSGTIGLVLSATHLPHPPGVCVCVFVCSRARICICICVSVLWWERKKIT